MLLYVLIKWLYAIQYYTVYYYIVIYLPTFQYGVYCVGAAGALVLLHSVRAVSHN